MEKYIVKGTVKDSSDFPFKDDNVRTTTVPFKPSTN